MKAPFKDFFAQLRETNATLDYFVDFAKARENTQRIAIKLNQLNYLIGRDDLRTAIKELYEENPKVFDVLDILIAVRKNKNTKVVCNEKQVVNLDSYFTTPEGIYTYIKETGLAKVFQNKDVKNLVDYVFGIEVGFDTNARKNRSGKIMANIISRYLDAAKIEHDCEVKSTKFPEITTFGTDIKRFDFVIQTPRKTYLIEANFYNVGGSKLNEVARAYQDIDAKIRAYFAYEFVWITDGQGGIDAKNKLEEAYNSISSVYNLTTLPDFIVQLQSELSNNAL